MSLDLTKGQRFNLTKESGGDSDFYIGLSWDTPKNSNKTFDMDASLLICGLDSNEDPKLISIDHAVYFGNLTSPEGGVVHSGDNLTGDADGDDEQIRVHLDRLPANAAELPIIFTLFNAVSKKQNFGQVRNCTVRICTMDAEGNPVTELSKFLLTDDYSLYTAVLVGQLYLRADGDWAFNALPQGFEKADLNTVLAHYAPALNT